LIFFSAEFWTV